MRKLNKIEEKFCRRILEREIIANKNDYEKNNLSFVLAPELTEFRLHGQKEGDNYSVTLQSDNSKTIVQINPDTGLREQTATFTPKKIKNSISSIITAIHLIRMLEKEGYLLLFQEDPLEDTFDVGSAKINEQIMYMTSSIYDEKINGSIIEYLFKDIIVTEEFKRFCKRGFIARDEQRFKYQIRTALTALIVATAAGLSNLYFNYIRSHAHPIEIKQSQIDELKGKIDTISNKLDSLQMIGEKVIKQKRKK